MPHKKVTYFFCLLAVIVVVGGVLAVDDIVFQRREIYYNQHTQHFQAVYLCAFHLLERKSK